MAGPYDWIDDDRRDDSRRAGPRRFSDEAGRYDRYDERSNGPTRCPTREDARAYAEHLREAAARGWRRFTEGARRVADDTRRMAEEDRRPEDVKPGWRAGGMFGGDDRSGSLFSHGNGVPAGGFEGPHRGKGPKGYVRSDARIAEDINDRLLHDGRLDASDIEVRVEDGEATLSGHVDSREAKRRAEDLAEQVLGVGHLQNNLRVKPPERPAQDAAPAPQPSAQARPAAEEPAESKVDQRGPDTGLRLN